VSKRQIKGKIKQLKKRIKQSQKSTNGNGTTKHCKNMQRKAAKIARKLRYM